MTNERSVYEIIAGLPAHWRMYLTEGFTLFILGLVVLFVPAVTQVPLSRLLGWILIAVGIAGSISSVIARRLPGFWWSLGSAILTFCAGSLLLNYSTTGRISYSLLLVAFFLVDGALTIVFALEHKRQLSRGWGWLCANGILDFGLAFILMLANPGLYVWIFSMVVGIDLIFAGWALSTMALAARSSVDRTFQSG